MAKVIFEQVRSKEIAAGKIKADSAAYNAPSGNKASKGAINAIKTLFDQDLLQSHQSKKYNQVLTEWADVIVVMSGRMKDGMPPAKTKTLKEFAGETGDMPDPFGQSDEVYLQCAKEIKRLIEIAFHDCV
jgi:protein-tyrosine-phosphatase